MNQRQNKHYKYLVAMVGVLFAIQLPYQQVLAHDSTEAKSVQKESGAESVKVYEDKTYGKYVKAEDFGLDTSGKTDGK